MKTKIYFNYGLGFPADDNPKNFDILPEDFFSGMPEKSDQELIGSYEHSICPAVKDWHKNNYFVKMPFDLNFKFNESKRQLQVINNPNTDVLTKKLLVLHESWIKNSSINEAQFTFYYLFWIKENRSKQDIWVETHHHPSLEECNIRLIPGRFPISAWSRPLHFAFKIIDKTKPVVLPKDKPLYYIRFRSNAPNQIFELEKAMPDVQVLKKLRKDSMFKIFCPFKSWDLIRSRLVDNESCPRHLWKI